MSSNRAGSSGGQAVVFVPGSQRVIGERAARRLRMRSWGGTDQCGEDKSQAERLASKPHGRAIIT